MTVLDDTLIPKVKTIVDKYGKVAVFKVLGTRSYDPTTMQTTEASSVDHTHDVTPPESYDRALVDGTNIQETDCFIGLPAQGLTFTPSPQMEVTMDSGETYRIISVGRVFSGESVALYYPIQLRR